MASPAMESSDEVWDHAGFVA